VRNGATPSAIVSATIPSTRLAPSTVAVLREHRKAQLEQRPLFGLGKARDDGRRGWTC